LLSIIGAVTGIFGAVLAVIAHRHSTSLSRTNVLHDVEAAHDVATRSVAGLIELLPHALRSRGNMLAARGSFMSGNMERFQNEHVTDTAAAEALKGRVTAIDDGCFARTSYEDLMKQLTELRKLQRVLDELTQKYEASLASDRNAADQLRADVRPAGPPKRG
jgi:hypothetical protein